MVPAVEHDFRAMFASPCGVYHLFDVGQCGDGPTSVMDVPTVRLGAPFPNPFNPRTTIGYSLAVAGRVVIEAPGTLRSIPACN